MVLLKRDLTELLLGIGVLALGLVILLFTFSQAFALAQNPGDFFRNQMAQVSPQTKGPTADFSYSGFDLNVTFTDRSTAGDVSIVSWNWDFGDNSTSTVQSPAHRFYNFGPWQVSLTVRDGNRQESRTFGQLTVAPQQPISGNAVGNPFGGQGGLNVNLDIGSFLLPVGVGLLATGMFLVMALVGGMITKAGWNLVKPKPETIRVRLKPKDLTQAIEDDSVPITRVPAPTPSTPPAPPPPQS